LEKAESNFQGELAKKPLVEVLGLIYSRKLSGELSVNVKKAEYTIYFLNGIPVYAQSSLKSDNLIELMVHLGELDRDDVPRLREMIKQGLETDHAIVKMGIADSTKIYLTKLLLAREIIIRASGHLEGKYQFQPGDGFLERIPLYDLSPMDIIYEALNRFLISYLPERMQKMNQAKVWLNPEIPELQSLPEIFYERTYLLDDFKDEVPMERAIHFLLNEFQDLNQAMSFIYVMMITGVLLVREEIPKPETRRERAGAEPRRMEKVSEKPAESKKKQVVSTDYIYTQDRKARPVKEKAPEPKAEVKRESARKPEPAEQKKTAEPMPGLEKGRKLELIESKIRSSNDYFLILGIKPDAPISEIEQIYHQILKQFEIEDILKGEDPELIRRASEVKDTIKKIINTLGNPEDRNQYEKSVYKDELKRAWSLELRKALAKKQFERGKWYLEHNRPDFALEKFEQANELNPEASDYYAYHGWALYRSGKGSPAQIDGYLKQAIRQNPRADTAYYFLGLISKREKADNLAEEYLQKALAINPNNANARRELDLIEKHKKEGIFQKLFKR